MAPRASTTTRDLPEQHATVGSRPCSSKAPAPSPSKREMASPVPSSRPKIERSSNTSSKGLRRSTRTSATLARPMMSTSTSGSKGPEETSDGTIEAASPSTQPTATRQQLAPHATFGQFSYVPATQTTVVTTTTTTTTTFPPLLFEGLRDLSDLDPKLYPLAATPTPLSLKTISFDLNGVPARFTEAEDASRALEDFNSEQSRLDGSGGIVEKVWRSESNADRQATRPTSSSLPVPQTSSRKRPASPISVVEAAEQASRRRDSLKAANRTSAFRRHLPSRSSQTTRHSTLGVPPRPADAALSPPGLATASSLADVRRRCEAEQGRRYLSACVAHDAAASDTETPPQSFLLPSPRVAPNTTVVLPAGEQVGDDDDEDDDKDDVSTVHDNPVTDQSALVGDDILAISAASIATATPPITDNDLLPAGHDYVGAGATLGVGGSGSHADQDPLSLISPTLAHDASLPSPSISPVTAALHYDAQRASDHGADADVDAEDGDVDSSFALPPPRRLVVDGDDDDDLDSRAVTRRRRKRSARFRTDEDAAVVIGPTESSSGTAGVGSRTLMGLPSMLDTFDAMPPEMQTYMIHHFLRRCSKPTLRTVAKIVNPALKVDFLTTLPPELGINIARYLDVRSMCRAAQVSKRWRQMLDSNERAWKELMDRDGYSLPPGELQRGIREGWGWQIPYGNDDYERDVSSLGMPPLEHGPAPAEGDDRGPSLARGRQKRKAATKSQSRKRLKKKENSKSRTAGEVMRDAWMSELAAVQGPYAAASAAAKITPNPPIGLPSLANLHLFKSIYRRNHVIRTYWMDESVKPTHIAFRAHERHVVTCLQFDWDKILTGSDDTSINVFDTRTGALRAKLEGHEGGVWALQYEGNTLVSGSTDRSVRVWDIERGRCTHIFHGHTSTVRCLQILMPTHVGYGSDGRSIRMPKEPLIITGSRDSTVRVWKLPQLGDAPGNASPQSSGDGDCPFFVRTLAGHMHSVRAIAAHGDTLVSGSYDATVRMWRISTGELVHRLIGHTSKVYSVVLDHTRNRCISGSMDNLVKIWSLDSGMMLFNLEGHSSLVGLLDLSHDKLVSAAADFTLRVWDPAFGQCRSTLRAHTGAITCFQHDGQKVISGSDRTVKMWNVQTGGFVRDLLTDLSTMWQVKFNERRCVAAVQRNQMTYIEVLDFGSSREAVHDPRRGRRVVVDVHGDEIPENAEEEPNEHAVAAAPVVAGAGAGAATAAISIVAVAGTATE